MVSVNKNNLKPIIVLESTCLVCTPIKVDSLIISLFHIEKKNKKEIKPKISISKLSFIPCMQPTPPKTIGKVFILNSNGQGLGDTMLYQ
jgi:hypothetical protein